MNEQYVSSILLKDREDIDFSQYPFSLPVVKNFNEIEFKSKVTFFVGENGSGKSTLLEAIAVKFGFNPEGGSRNFRFSTAETHSELCNHLAMVRGARRARDGYFLRAESFYNVASEIEKMDEIVARSPLISSSYGGKSLHEQSHGESFLSLILNRFGGKGMYILDEPESALSISRQLSLLSRINELEKQQSQFIIATHSPILLAYPNAEIYVLSENAITLTPYQETENYTLMKQFINNPEGILKHLLEE